MSSSLPKTHSSVSPTCDTPQVCKTRRLRLQPLVRPPAAFPAGPCRRAGDVVGGFWFARLLGTRWGKASNYHILSIGRPWGIHDLSSLFLLQHAADPSSRPAQHRSP